MKRKNKALGIQKEYFLLINVKTTYFSATQPMKDFPMGNLGIVT